MKIGVAGPVMLSFFQDLFPSGTQLPVTYGVPLIAKLAREMYDRGYDIAVFALSSEVGKVRLFRGDRFEAYVCPQRRPRQQMTDFFGEERRALAQAMRESCCDVIHAHWTYEFGAAAIESNMPCVITAHDSPFATLIFARHPYWLLRPLLSFSVIRKARYITAVCSYVADCLYKIRRRQDVTIIGNGVATEIFELYSRPKKRRDDQIVFTSVLNYWRGLKNGRRLVEAFAKLRKHFGPKVQLWLFGIEYSPGGPAKEWACAHGADAGVQFRGSVEHSHLMETLAEQVDVLVHPSLQEAHCMAVIEAMAMGIPVIGGESSGGLPATLDYGNAGMLVDVKSRTAIARGMQILADDQKLRHKIAREGRKFALREYQLDHIVERYLACLTGAARHFTS